MILEIPEIEFEERVSCKTCKGSGYIEVNGGITKTGRKRTLTESCPDCTYGRAWIPSELGERLLDFLEKYKDRRK